MRKADWMQQLEGAISIARLIPFTWGLHDCVTFAAHCVDAMCGTAHVARIQAEDAYSSEEGAYAVIAANGGWVGLISKYLGAPEPTPHFAAPGDVVLVNNHGRELLGVVVGHHIVAACEVGLATLPYEQIQNVWKV